MNWTLFIDIAGTIIGLIYLWLEYRASIWLWLASVIMPIVNAWLYYERGIYADFAMQVYYVLAAVYGYIIWRYKGRRANPDDVGQGICHITAATTVAIMGCVMVLWGALYWLLTSFTDSTVPVLDSLTTAVSIVAMWALAQKYVEQWLLWFVVDLVCAGLYVYKGIPFHGALYGFYTVMAIAGYRRWCKLASSQIEDNV